MNDQAENNDKGGYGYLIWGTIFSFFGIMELHRRLMVVAGIPLWALALLTIGLSNLLKAPPVLNLLRVPEDWKSSLSRITSLILAAGLFCLVTSILIVVFRS
ncbi:MAG: hypothetical protein JXB45_01530 [Candidatus Krumholzibacteriota bacterium]|nr:hypothetical protein [Candidatus Krumholzibacteriota bacterium]